MTQVSLTLVKCHCSQSTFWVYSAVHYMHGGLRIHQAAEGGRTGKVSQTNPASKLTSKLYTEMQQRKEMSQLTPLMPDRLSDPLLDVGEQAPGNPTHACPPEISQVSRLRQCLGQLLLLWQSDSGALRGGLRCSGAARASQPPRGAAEPVGAPAVPPVAWDQ